MMYRFGDATPFPLDENFIDTICAATDTCVALFEANVIAADRRARSRDIADAAATELKRLEVLARAVSAAVSPMVAEGKATKTSEVTAGRIVQAARNTVKQARAGLVKRRDAAIRKLYDTALGANIRQAVASFLLEHQLPDTKWTVRWAWDRERARANTTVKSTARCGVRADYTAEVPEHHELAQPIRVGELEPNLVIQLEKETGWLRRHPRLRAEPLHRMYITEIELAPERESIVLRKSIKKPSPGFLIEIRDGSERRPTVTRIDAEGRTPPLPLTLSGDSAKALVLLWDNIEERILELRDYRTEVQTARFGELPVEDLESPGELADVILDTLAPLIREMRVRSRVPGELVLKRDTGDGRREELFVPRERLESKFSGLPDRDRRHFEAVGLSAQATREFIGCHLPLEAPRTPMPRLRSPGHRARRSPVPPPPPLPRKFSSPVLRDVPPEVPPMPSKPVRPAKLASKPPVIPPVIPPAKPTARSVPKPPPIPIAPLPKDEETDFGAADDDSTITRGEAA